MHCAQLALFADSLPPLARSIAIPTCRSLDTTTLSDRHHAAGGSGSATGFSLLRLAPSTGPCPRHRTSEAAAMPGRLQGRPHEDAQCGAAARGGSGRVVTPGGSRTAPLPAADAPATWQSIGSSDAGGCHAPGGPRPAPQRQVSSAAWALEAGASHKRAHAHLCRVACVDPVPSGVATCTFAPATPPTPASLPPSLSPRRRTTTSQAAPAPAPRLPTRCTHPGAVPCAAGRRRWPTSTTAQRRAWSTCLTSRCARRAWAGRRRWNSQRATAPALYGTLVSPLPCGGRVGHR